MVRGRHRDRCCRWRRRAATCAVQPSGSGSFLRDVRGTASRRRGVLGRPNHCLCGFGPEWTIGALDPASGLGDEPALARHRRRAAAVLVSRRAFDRVLQRRAAETDRHRRRAGQDDLRSGKYRVVRSTRKLGRFGRDCLYEEPPSFQRLFGRQRARQYPTHSRDWKGSIQRGCSAGKPASGRERPGSRGRSRSMDLPP